MKEIMFIGRVKILLENFKINNVIFNQREYNTLESNLIKNYQKKLSYLKNKRNFKLKSIYFVF